MYRRLKFLWTALICSVGTGVLIVASSCTITPYTQLDKGASLEVLDTLIFDPLVRQYAAMEVPGARNVSLHDGYAAFHLFDGQPLLNKGIRSELTIDFPFSPGDTLVYEWEVRIPEGFISDYPLNRWWVMAQWHDQPDLDLGETWDTFPSHSPPVAFYLGELDGQLYLAPEYLGHDTLVEELIELPIGEWLQMRVEIHWSQSVDGYMKVLAGGPGASELLFSGRNMLNDYQHYLKLGMYRHRDISTDNTVHLRIISVKIL